MSLGQLSEDERLHIRELFVHGFSFRQIAHIIGCDDHTAKRWCDLRASVKNSHSKKTTAGKRKFSQTDMAKLDRILEVNPSKGIHKLAHEIEEEIHTHVSERTLRNYQRYLGFSYGYGCVKPRLSDKQKKTRLAWCLAHRNTDWSKWWFWDESLFDRGALNCHADVGFGDFQRSHLR